MTDLEYNNAMRKIEVAMSNGKVTSEIDSLIDAVQKYEAEKYPKVMPDPVEAIKFRMDQMGHRPADLVKRVGISRSHLSEVLNRKRKLSLDMIRGFHRYGISLEVLVREYDL